MPTVRHSLDKLQTPRKRVSRSPSEEDRLEVSSEPSSPSLPGAGAPARSRPRPILSKSHSVDAAPLSTSAEKRSVSFRLPEETDEHSHSKMNALAQSLKKLTLAAAAASASRPKPEKTTKRILRQPVVHVYLRGASGLPTQRVPLSTVNALHRHPFRASIS